MPNIIARLDPATNHPVVFNTDAMTDDSIECWDGKATTEQVSMSYYHTCKPLSAADMAIMCKRYAKHIGSKDVFVRYRLPRTVREVPSILTTRGRPAAQPAVVAAVEPVQPAKRGRKPAVMPDAPTMAAVPDTSVDMVAAIAGLQAEFNDKFAALLRAATKK